MLRAWFTVVFGASALGLMWLGCSWIFVGYGLNPWIAFPFAGAVYLMPFMLFQRDIDLLEDEIEETLDAAASMYSDNAEMADEIHQLKQSKQSITDVGSSTEWAQATVEKRHHNPFEGLTIMEDGYLKPDNEAA
jgi:hypothetical protein